MHARNFEDTDDAQIDGNLSPIGTRIDGNIIKVYVQNNQTVKVGDPLVDLDPRDNQVSLDQAEAQVRQAQSMLSSQRPNVPITQVQNSTNILSARADVVSFGSGHRDSRTGSGSGSRAGRSAGGGKRQGAKRSEALPDSGG